MSELKEITTKFPVFFWATEVSKSNEKKQQNKNINLKHIVLFI